MLLFFGCRIQKQILLKTISTRVLQIGDFVRQMIHRLLFQSEFWLWFDFIKQEHDRINSLNFKNYKHFYLNIIYHFNQNYILTSRNNHSSGTLLDPSFKFYWAIRIPQAQRHLYVCMENDSWKLMERFFTEPLIVSWKIVP